jgi:hypothetical protein
MALSIGQSLKIGICAAVLLNATEGPAAWADQQIGSAAQIVNSVTGTLASNRQSLILRAGIDVFQNETITTAYASASRVVFEDQTQLSIGPVSQIVLDRFVFDPNPAAAAVSVSIAKGVARFSTGILPKPDYQIHTPSCQIGVRGTVLTAIVSEARATWVTVDEGVATVSAQGVTVTVNAGQTTFVAFGQPPTQPTASTLPPPVTTQMDALLFPTTPTVPPGGTGPYGPPAGGYGYQPGGYYGPSPGFGGVPGPGFGGNYGSNFGGGERGGTTGGGNFGGGNFGGGRGR